MPGFWVGLSGRTLSGNSVVSEKRKSGIFGFGSDLRRWLPPRLSHFWGHRYQSSHPSIWTEMQHSLYTPFPITLTIRSPPRVTRRHKGLAAMVAVSSRWTQTQYFSHLRPKRPVVAYSSLTPLTELLLFFLARPPLSPSPTHPSLVYCLPCPSYISSAPATESKVQCSLCALVVCCFLILMNSMQPNM